MSSINQPLVESWRGERTLFSVSGPLDDLPLDRLAGKHQEMLDYWRSKAEDDWAPRRAAIDPLEIPRLLPNLTLWDVDSSDDYLCRLSGSEVDLSMGVPMKGTWLGQMKCPLLGEAKDEFDAVRDRGIASFAERTMGWLGKPYLYYRHLLLPLSNERNQIHMLVGVLTFHPVADLH